MSSSEGSLPTGGGSAVMTYATGSRTACPGGASSLDAATAPYIQDPWRFSARAMRACT